jgi:membrane protease YdiL (CAAX protease family)
MLLVFTALAGYLGVESGVEALAVAESYAFPDAVPSALRVLFYVLSRIVDFSFTITAFVLVFASSGRDGVVAFVRRLFGRVSWKWLALAALLPLAVYGTAAAVALLGVDPGGAVSAASGNRSLLFRLTISLETGVLVSIFLRGGMGEEPGLRGYILPRLSGAIGVRKATALIGVFWVTWHLPVLLGRDIVSVAAFVLTAFGFSALFSLFYYRSKSSILPVVVLHGLINWEEGYELLFPRLTAQDWELVSTLIFLLVGVLAWIRLGRLHGGAERVSGSGIGSAPES